ncbi:MAG: YraN family protein, partial [Candidatus Cloacimonetes bacterium]|nr:YraN family protein [Candidatus Cloacimonadota bacterium]
LIFVEVKTRSHHTIDSAVENINFRKQRKISLTALIYTKQNPQFDKHNTRFDAIILLYDRCEDAFSVRHFEDAFLPVGIDPES